MKIGILGCGWLGLPLAKSLAKDGHQVNGSTTQESKLQKLKDAGITPFLISLDPALNGDTSFFELELLILNIPPRNREGQPDFHENQLVSVKEQALRKGVQKIIFVSSTGVYPNLNREVTENDASLERLSRGGVQLLRMEQLFTDSEIKTTVIRFGGLYGPDRHPGRFLAGKKNLSGADNPVNMIHLEDCIGVIKSIVQQNEWGNTFNACSPNHTTRKEFYEQEATDLGIEPPTFSNEPSGFKKVNSDRLVTTLNYSFSR